MNRQGLKSKPIIKTRYRDVDLSTFIAEHAIPGTESEKIWQRVRGTPIEIETPPVSVESTGMASHTKCREPHYRVVGSPFYVCSHIAEIGD